MSHLRSIAVLRVVATLAIGLVVPVTARAAVIWTLVGSPLAAPAGVPTTFTLKATNENVLTTIGCIEVDTKTSGTKHFDVTATAVTNGLPWTIGVTDSRTFVTAHSTTSGGALGFPESVVFTIRATPLDSGAFSWSATAYKDINCGGAPLPGIELVAIVVTGVAPTPSATPGPSPTAAPTPTVAPTAPIPRPTPAPSATPLPAATVDPAASERPSAGPTPATSPAAGRSPRPSASLSAQPSVDPDPGATRGPDATAAIEQAAGGGTRPGSGGAEGDVFTIRSTNVSVSPDLGSSSVGASALLLLSVPAILFSVPGLFLVLVFLAQLTGGLVWIPVIRRHLTRQPDPPRARFSRRTDRA